MFFCLGIRIIRIIRSIEIVAWDFSDIMTKVHVFCLGIRVIRIIRSFEIVAWDFSDIMTKVHVFFV